jgi:hypothetical protein
MARPNSIWWWEQKGEYAVTIEKKRHRLGTDRKEADRQMHELLGKRPEEKVAPQSAAGVMDTFLDEATFKSAETKGWYQKHCPERVEDVAPLDQVLVATASLGFRASVWPRITRANGELTIRLINH